MNFYDINLINGGHISIKEFDKKAISPFHKEAFLHVYSNVNKQATVILERSEMIALSLILQERIMHYPSYSFTAAMFEKAIKYLKEKNKVALDFRMLRYKNNMALAYSEMEGKGLLFVADSDNRASAFSFTGELLVREDYSNEMEFEFIETRGLEIEQLPECNITYIDDYLYFGK